MKTINFLVVVLIGVLVFRCAQVGPRMVSPAVYSSSRDTVVAENQLQKTKMDAEKTNKVLEQERAKEWQKVAIAEIQGKADTNVPVKTVSIEGVLGGFPCIFINDSQTNKNLTIQKIGGFLDGNKWNFDLLKFGGIKKYNLPDGNYRYWWTIKYSSQKYPEKPKYFTATITPHYYYAKTEENFHGGVRLFGN